MFFFLQSKEFEIHLQIGESLVLCVEGVNSNDNRDLWTELPKEVRVLYYKMADDDVKQYISISIKCYREKQK